MLFYLFSLFSKRGDGLYLSCVKLVCDNNAKFVGETKWCVVGILET